MPRILHIEDDPANRLLVRKLLMAAGHEVVDAADGLEGVRLACAQRPDLVLVDLNIPGLDGFEVALRLRGEASLAGVPIVAITAEGDRETSLAVGCDGFLQKPIDARSFSTTLQRYLKGAKETAAPGARSARLMEQSPRIVAPLEEKVAELSGANARLRELDTARTEFYRNISHELATPMTPIVGYVKLLKDEELGPLTKAQQKALRSMDDCVRRLRVIIDNLLDVTGMETGRMRFHHAEYDFLDTTRRALAAVATGWPRPGSNSSRSSRAARSPPGATPTGSSGPSPSSWTTRPSSPRRAGPSGSGYARWPRVTSSSAWRTPGPGCGRTGCTASSSRSTRWTARSPASTAGWGWGSPSCGGPPEVWGATCGSSRRLGS